MIGNLAWVGGRGEGRSAPVSFERVGKRFGVVTAVDDLNLASGKPSGNYLPCSYDGDRLRLYGGVCSLAFTAGPSKPSQRSSYAEPDQHQR